MVYLMTAAERQQLLVLLGALNDLITGLQERVSIPLSNAA
jgi:hypothetical protein